MPVCPADAKAVFLDAVAVEDAAARTALVARLCGADAELLARVHALLAANDRACESEIPPANRATIGGLAMDATVAEAGPGGDEGMVIAGKYTLLEVIGEGGMGTVWRAGQREPVKRFVAVKLIRAGMDTGYVLARFDTERRALALMDHANIARVYDGGITDGGSGGVGAGRPYFVMELVKGIPITEYCDRHKLTPRQRLELFVPVCQAIQHAHQKGVIHRDIKPSNVLVAHDGTRPVVKVIDFGIAKATTEPLTGRTFATGFGTLVGTPEYMSPEQATFDCLDIDTRSDIYALGVLLYELLTGSPPFSAKALERKGLLEILRVVREEEPQRPSTRLSTADALPTLSANRGTEPGRLTGLLRSELDWIVMKALEKDRSRRYDTANGFAADVQRYLAGEPVLAHPPSAAYRFRKFVRRNRMEVVAGMVVFATLLAGMVGTAVGLIQARNAAESERAARNDAMEQKRLAERRADSEAAAKRDAERNLDFARKGNQILGSDFDGLNPRTIAESGLSLQEVLRQNLAAAVKELEGSAIGDPLEVAAMQVTLAKSLLALGDAGMAIDVMRKALDTRKARLGPDHLQTLSAMNNLGHAYKEDGQTAKAIPLFEEVLEREQATIGPDHPSTLVTMNSLGSAYLRSDQFAKALPMLEKALEKRRAVLGPDHADTLNSLGALAVAHEQRGQHDKAIPLLEEVVGKRKATLGPNHPHTLTAMGNLATVYLGNNQPAKAMPLLEEVLERRKGTLGSDHPATLGSLNALATFHVGGKRFAQAVPLLEEVAAKRTAKLGADHPDTLETMNNLSVAYQKSNQSAKAVPLQEETVAKLNGKLGPDHPETLAATGVLATLYLTGGQPAKSLPLLEGNLARTKAKLGPDHPYTLAGMGNLAAAYKASGQLAKAVPLFEETLEGMKARLGPDDPGVHNVMGHLGKAYVDARQGGKAATMLAEYVNAMRKRSPQGSAAFAGLLGQVSLDLLSCGQAAAAEPLLRESLAIREKARPDAWDTFDAYSLLGGALLGQQKYADAKPLLLKGYEGMKQNEKAIPPSSPCIPAALDRLIELSTAMKDTEEAGKWRAERAKYPLGVPPK